MRQVLLQVPDDDVAAVIDRLREHDARNVAAVAGTGADGRGTTVVLCTLGNREVGPLVEDLQAATDIRVTIPDTGVFSLHPPAETPPGELVDISPRSPIEVFLAGVQSAGSWPSFIAYASTAALVVWIGLHTETIYLLTAAMLLAPFGGPAMNTAIAAAAGDLRLLRSSVLRYGVGLGTTVAVSAALTLIVGQGVPTPLTFDVLSISGTAVLLPVAAGVAGALYLVNSEHSSLVSGAAVGVLVAASLAPPAGGLGVALVLGRFDLVGRAAFLLALQLVGITLAAATIFRGFGLSWSSRRFSDRRRGTLPAVLVACVLVIAALLVVQLVPRPGLQRASTERFAAELAIDAVRGSGVAAPLDVDARFMPLRTGGRERILVTVRAEALEPSPDDATLRIEDAVRARLEPALEAVPVIDVTLHDPPP